MKCGNCGSQVNDEWDFCPKCGVRFERKDVFSDVFERVEGEMNHLNKLFEKNFEVFDISPFFKKTPMGNGFSIKITQSADQKPRVSVKTFGNVDKKDIEHEIERMGFKPKAKKNSKPETATFGVARVTEEPKTDVKRIGDKILVEIKLPEVKDEKDIQINSLENSIEVKAITGNKAYFKILTKPPKSRIIGQSFSKGMLHLEFG